MDEKKPQQIAPVLDFITGKRLTNKEAQDRIALRKKEALSVGHEFIQETLGEINRLRIVMERCYRQAMRVAGGPDSEALQLLMYEWANLVSSVFDIHTVWSKKLSDAVLTVQQIDRNAFELVSLKIYRDGFVMPADASWRISDAELPNGALTILRKWFRLRNF